VNPLELQIGRSQAFGVESEALGGARNDEREAGQPAAPPEYGVPAGSPLAVGARQSGETITIRASRPRLGVRFGRAFDIQPDPRPMRDDWFFDTDPHAHDLDRFADDGGPAR
jgi:hypothetical protein